MYKYLFLALAILALVYIAYKIQLNEGFNIKSHTPQDLTIAGTLSNHDAHHTHTAGDLTVISANSVASDDYNLTRNAFNKKDANGEMQEVLGINNDGLVNASTIATKNLAPYSADKIVINSDNTINFPKKIYNLQKLSNNIADNLGEINADKVTLKSLLKVGDTTLLPIGDDSLKINAENMNLELGETTNLPENAILNVKSPQISGNLKPESATVEGNLDVTSNDKKTINMLKGLADVNIVGNISPSSTLSISNPNPNDTVVELSTNGSLNFETISNDTTNAENIKGNTLNNTTETTAENLNVMTIGNEEGDSVEFKNNVKTTKGIQNANNIDIYGKVVVDGTVLASKLCNTDGSTCYSISEISDIISESENSGNVKTVPMPSYKYYGCYKKDAFPRDKGPSTKKKGSRKKYNVDSCHEMCAGYNYFGLFKDGKCYCAFDNDMGDDMQMYDPEKCRKGSNGKLIGNSKFVAVYNRLDEDYDNSKEFSGEFDRDDEDESAGNHDVVIDSSEFGFLDHDGIREAIERANQITSQVKNNPDSANNPELHAMLIQIENELNSFDLSKLTNNQRKNFQVTKRTIEIEIQKLITQSKSKTFEENVGKVFKQISA